MRLGIALLSGLFGRFDFGEARKMFELASQPKRGSIPFAIVLRDSLSISDYKIMNATDFSIIQSIFSFLRSTFHESIPLIRILNPHIRGWDQSVDQWNLSWIYRSLNQTKLPLPLIQIIWFNHQAFAHFRRIYRRAIRFLK
jgi:hypothetical protein